MRSRVTARAALAFGMLAVAAACAASSPRAGVGQADRSRVSDAAADVAIDAQLDASVDAPIGARKLVALPSECPAGAPWTGTICRGQGFVACPGGTRMEDAGCKGPDPLAGAAPPDKLRKDETTDEPSPEEDESHLPRPPTPTPLRRHH